MIDQSPARRWPLGRLRLGGVSLRRRLLAGVLALVALALLISSTLTYAALRTFLNHRLDASVQVTQRGVAAAVRGALPGGGIPDSPGSRVDTALGHAVGAQLPPGGVAALARRGQPLRLLAVGDPKRVSLSSVALPPDVATAATAVESQTNSRRAVLLTRRLPAGMYRLVVAPVRQRGTVPAAVVVVGFPLADTDTTLHRLLLVEVAVVAGALAAVGLLGLIVVRRGLQPLDAVVATADGIAAGDLTRRVPVAASRTEVGRLAGALNRMLTDNEAAFAARAVSEQRLRRFLADAGHELRTPLASVRGYAELLRSGRVDDAQVKLSLSRIESEAVRMGRIVDDLLLLARLDQGRPLRQDPIDLAALAEQAARDLRVLDPGRPVDVEAPTPVITVGDADRLRQVMDNLLTNARVHTPPGTAVTIRAHTDTDTHTAVLEVTDTGPGMSAEVAANVFQPFYQADPTATHDGQISGGSSGLGLAIVSAIVEAHAGDIRLATAEQAGTRFTVTLPNAGPDAQT